MSLQNSPLSSTLCSEVPPRIGHTSLLPALDMTKNIFEHVNKLVKIRVIDLIMISISSAPPRTCPYFEIIDLHPWCHFSCIPMLHPWFIYHAHGTLNIISVYKSTTTCICQCLNVTESMMGIIGVNSKKCPHFWHIWDIVLNIIATWHGVVPLRCWFMFFSWTHISLSVHYWKDLYMLKDKMVVVYYDTFVSNILAIWPLKDVFKAEPSRSAQSAAGQLRA